ncbi:MAG: DUF697 domain-containing protein [Nitrospirae bacterium]|nr:DUF697 domain-containing protein [Nitrospirota bacterium]MBF0536206.1 DUF697 domain-containing protein [Nitrospirota bacterium]MBF0617318.1 DUF697 domain-containing protein [Nitrospirota bacterium]
MTEKEEEQSPKEQIRVSRARKRHYQSSMEEITMPEVTMENEAVVNENITPKSEDACPTLMQAKKIVRDHSIFSAVPSLVPIPLLDSAAAMVVQLRMLKKLGDLYGVAFSKQKVKTIIASLVGGIGTGAAAGSLVKTVPVVGMAVGVISMAVSFGAITYAIGIVFVNHFETGGTFLDFDLEKGKEAVKSSLSS